jgi:hypothetical protein
MKRALKSSIKCLGRRKKKEKKNKHVRPIEKKED